MTKGLLKNKNFMLFLLSQGIASFGDAFQLIATTSLLVTLTGSGIAAAFGVLSYPVASILLSPLAGTFGDRHSCKSLMIIIDISKCMVISLFTVSKNIYVIFSLVLILSALEILYSPVRKKMTTKLLARNETLAGNSLQNGIFGGTFLIGPAAAGIVLHRFGVSSGFWVKMASSILCALTLLIIREKWDISSHKPRHKGKTGYNSEIIRGIKEGYYYCRNNRKVKEYIWVSTFIAMGVAAVNTAFYPYAFDKLKLTSRDWGFMMSIYYGAGFLSMFVSGCLYKFIGKKPLISVYTCAFTAAFMWYLYSITGKPAPVFLYQFVEGLVLSVCSIILTTQLQLLPDREYVARIAGINDFFNNIGKLASISAAYLILLLFPVRIVFVAASAFVFSISAFKLYAHGFDT